MINDGTECQITSRLLPITSLPRHYFLQVDSTYSKNILTENINTKKRKQALSWTVSKDIRTKYIFIRLSKFHDNYSCAARFIYKSLECGHTCWPIFSFYNRILLRENFPCVFSEILSCAVEPVNTLLKSSLNTTLLVECGILI
jgi:hypothetical protein